MKWFFIGIALYSVLVLLLVHHVESSSCYLPYHLLQNEWRLALVYKDGELTFLREQEVPSGTLLYMVCNSDDVIEVTCENGEFKPQMPLPYCNNHLKPELRQAYDPQLCPYQLYLVGFNIKCKEQQYFFHAYKVCFDVQQKRAVFTINEAYPFVLPRPRGMQFDPDEIFTMNIFAAYNKRDIYGRFNTLLGSEQKFMPSNAGDTRIDRGHLTPVTDFFMNTLISATFKMINVIPQFHTINDGNWKQIEEWTRNPMHTPCKVCSGALHWVLSLPDVNGLPVNMYLRDNLIPIPLWTYKVVLNHQGIRTVFLQYNNIHDTSSPPKIPSGICEVIQCPTTICFKDGNLNGYTYCCEERQFMRNVVPNLQGQC